MGTSPQVLTETLYAIHKQGKPFPEEVYLITTENAKEKVVEWLFEKNKIEELKNTHYIPDFKFDESHILLMKHDDGGFVFSGREEEDQQSIANSITRLVARFTADDDCSVHASIAGGRKSMAFYMGYAMSMFAREQDVLSHVFVSKEFEFSDQFFFPTKTDSFIANNNRVLNSKDAEVTLAEIPFVRMRGLVDEALIKKLENEPFSEIVKRFNSYSTEGVRVFLSGVNKTFSVNGFQMPIPPKELAFYLWISQLPDRSINVNRDFCEDKLFSASYLKFYSRVANDSRVYASFGVDEVIVRKLSERDLAECSELQPFSKDWIQQVRSKINNQIRKFFDTELVGKVSIFSDEFDTKLHQVRYFIRGDVSIGDDLKS